MSINGHLVKDRTLLIYGHKEKYPMRAIYLTAAISLVGAGAVFAQSPQIINANGPAGTVFAQSQPMSPNGTTIYAQSPQGMVPNGAQQVTVTQMPDDQQGHFPRQGRLHLREKLHKLFHPGEDAPMDGQVIQSGTGAGCNCNTNNSAARVVPMPTTTTPTITYAPTTTVTNPPVMGTAPMPGMPGGHVAAPQPAY
jgi:hypothetical protein